LNDLFQINQDQEEGFFHFLLDHTDYTPEMGYRLQSGTINEVGDFNCTVEHVLKNNKIQIYLSSDSISRIIETDE
jgi:hypothetical protein